jgi:NADH-quinone oxidoreductase subunit J
LKIRASNPNMITIINPKDIGTRLYTTYLLGVEMSGFLLLAGMVGAYHLGRQRKINLRKEK